MNNFLKRNKIGIFIITRYNSKRLRQKASIKINNQINLTELLLERIVHYFNNFDVTICTTKTNNNINFYKKIGAKYKVDVFFGPEKNMIKRVINCMEKKNLKHFVRVTGDNPMTDPLSILNLAKNHIKNKNEYTYTDSLPHGMKPEIFSLSGLKKNINKIVNLNSTEYLTYFFHRPDLYKIQKIDVIKKFKNQNFLSITVDYKKDILLLKNLIRKYKTPFIERNKIISFLKKHSNKIVKKKQKVFLKTKAYNAKYKFDSDNKFIIINKR